MNNNLKVFGTDGIRGKVGEHPMTVDFTNKFASAIATVLAPRGGTVVIGKDTRISGYMFESALEAAFVARGLDVVLVGPLPTPAISFITTDISANFGIVISASHNSYEYNGIKILTNKGEKLDVRLERDIENQLINEPITLSAETIGKARRLGADSRDAYIHFISRIFDSNKPLTDMKIVIDCSHGAAYKIAPRLLSSLGAEVIPIGCSPNGYNINLKSGSTNLENIINTVPALSADLGIALDGDADRVALIDTSGETIEGDQILYILSKLLINDPRFNSKVVGTILTNSGLEKSLKKQSIDLYRSEVGDKNVLDLMKQTGSIIGGENSGHIINLEYSPSGDGLMTSLLVIKAMINDKKSLNQLLDGLELVPQFNKNIEVNSSIISQEVIKDIADKANTVMKDGRVLVRKSGTEPVIRITIETHEQKKANIAIEAIKTQISKIN